MDKEKDKELANLINQWFKTNAYNPHKWNRSAAGQAIRAGVDSCGNWKNATRGNPRKGKEGQLLYYARQRGDILSEENEEREDYD